MAVSRRGIRPACPNSRTFCCRDTLLVVSETESHTLARQVFITANDRGVQLRPIDIFKGQLLTWPRTARLPRWSPGAGAAFCHVIGDGIEDFMCAYDFVKRCEPQGADHLTKLAASIEQELRASPPEPSCWTISCAMPPPGFRFTRS